MALEGRLRAEIGLQAALAAFEQPSRASKPPRSKKMPENHHAIDSEGGRDVRLVNELRLEQFQAQPKW
jgi:hypothetical protein